MVLQGAAAQDYYYDDKQYRDSSSSGYRDDNNDNSYYNNNNYYPSKDSDNNNKKYVCKDGPFEGLLTSSVKFCKSADITVPTDFTTIQAAINASSPGDTIKVLPGTYTEQLTISKNLTIIGSGAKSTIIQTPTVLNTNVNEQPYIIEVNNEAKVSIKGFTITGPEGTDCDTLVGISILDNGSINLKSVVIKGCTQNAILIGAVEFFPGGPQVGHATITKTFITDYREHGVFALGSGSTLTMSYNKVVGSAPDALGIIGILFVLGATGTITHNEVSENICNIPDICGTDYFTQFQAFGIVADSAGADSVISKNYISNNDAGIGVVRESGCCIIDYNKLTDNRFFGILIQDGEHTISNTKIFGGKVGAAAIAITANTTATLDSVKIVDAEIPVQALSTGNLTAAVNVISPSFFLP